MKTLKNSGIMILAAAATVFVCSGSALLARNTDQFTAHLSGSEEVADPPVVTRAQGQAIFRLSRDGSSIRYRLVVANIQNVMMAHIHLAPAGQNGPVVAWLYPEAPPPELIEGRVNGVLAVGTIAAEDLVGPLAGFSIDELIGAMLDGEAYVNVHTSQYPAGEIRGQIR